MTSRALLIAVRFHDGRYHGSGDWPPSPARLFQALVAGAARGRSLSESAIEALMWLEGLSPPRIATPATRNGQAFKNFVPNNDLDAVGGDPARVGEIRAAKSIRPRHFDAALPLLYAWTFKESTEAERHARAICDVSAGLYQLGRGVDMAWAQGELMNEADADARLRAPGGAVHRPSNGGAGIILACPKPGSIASLLRRHAASRGRFKKVGKGKKAQQLFSQAPKADFASARYDSPPRFLLFDIMRGDTESGFAPRPAEHIVALTERVRDMAAKRLRQSDWRREDPKREPCIDKIFIGRESTEADKAQRIRILPLPSIGHVQTERSIRRVLIEVPPNCPIAAPDIEWAFSGLAIDFDEKTGEVPVGAAMLVSADDSAMLDHYGIGPKEMSRLWRTVTPAALPRAARRRIDPRRIREEAKGGAERLREHMTAEWAVHHALRHAGIETKAEMIRAQREPFEARGQRVEAFAPNKRFAKEQLWHVEIGFAEPIVGPLVIGDGRYLGLGLMAPLRRTDGVFALFADGLAQQADHNALCRALRRAVMARVQDRLGPRAKLPAFFTGHEPGGAPARPGRHEHLAFAFDTPRSRLIVLAPHRLERREVSRSERELLAVLEQALEGFVELRAGPAGLIALVATEVDYGSDPLFTPSRVWQSVTPYRVTRHLKKGDAASAIEADLAAECRRAWLPRPDIEITEPFGKSESGLFGRARLTFRIAVDGPILLGKDRHFGGGLFAPA